MLAASAYAKFNPHMNRGVGKGSACGVINKQDAPGLDHSNYMVKYYAKGKNDANVFAILMPRSCQEVLDDEAAYEEMIANKLAKKEEREQNKADREQKKADREAKKAAKEAANQPEEEEEEEVVETGKGKTRRTTRRTDPVGPS